MAPKRQPKRRCNTKLLNKYICVEVTFQKFDIFQGKTNLAARLIFVAKQHILGLGSKFEKLQ